MYKEYTERMEGVNYVSHQHTLMNGQKQRKGTPSYYEKKI